MKRKYRTTANIRHELRYCGRPGHGIYVATGVIPFTFAKWTGCPKCVQEKEQARARTEQVARRLKSFENDLRLAGLESRFWDKSFENFYPQSEAQRKILEVVASYGDDFASHRKACRCLGFLGDVGTGKTHLAVSLIRQIVTMDMGFSARYVRAYDMFSALKESWDYGNRKRSESEVMQDFIQPDLLVIDEIGVQFLTKTEEDLMYKIIEGRYGRKNPTAIISNLPPPPPGKNKRPPHVDLRHLPDLDVEDAMGVRSYDRLIEGGGIILKFRGTSYRRRDAHREAASQPHLQ